MNIGRYLGEEITYEGKRCMVWSFDSDDVPNVTLYEIESRKKIELTWDEFINLIR